MEKYYVVICFLDINKGKGKGKVIPLQARLWPRGGYRYSSTLPRPQR